MRIFVFHVRKFRLRRMEHNCIFVFHVRKYLTRRTEYNSVLIYRVRNHCKFCNHFCIFRGHIFSIVSGVFLHIKLEHSYLYKDSVAFMMRSACIQTNQINFCLQNPLFGSIR
jgi:hypothetical protein